MVRLSALQPTIVGLICLGCLFVASHSVAESNDISSAPTKEAVVEPAWFKLSFLDMQADLEEAKESKKKGLILYFGQKHCPYCKKFLDDNFYNNEKISAYTRQNFDVVSINVRGSKSVTGFKGATLSERKFAFANKAHLTPTIMFYNIDGKPVLKLVGYQRPQKFHSALQFVVDGKFRDKSFSKYLTEKRDREFMSDNKDKCPSNKLALSTYLTQVVSPAQLYCFLAK